MVMLIRNNSCIIVDNVNCNDEHFSHNRLNVDVQNNFEIFLQTWIFGTKIVAGLLTLIINLLVLVVLIISKSSRPQGSIFIGSLMVADILFPLVSMPFALYQLKRFGSHFTNSDITICQVTIFFYLFAILAEILNMIAVTLDRYIAVTRPFRYKEILSPCRTAILIMLLWVFSVIFSLIGGITVVTKQPTRSCFAHEILDRRFISFLCATLVLAVLFLFIAYVKIINEVRNNFKRTCPINLGKFEQDLTPKISAKDSKHQSRLIRRKHTFPQCITHSNASAEIANSLSNRGPRTILRSPKSIKKQARIELDDIHSATNDQDNDAKMTNFELPGFVQTNAPYQNISTEPINSRNDVSSSFVKLNSRIFNNAVECTSNNVIDWKEQQLEKRSTIERASKVHVSQEPISRHSKQENSILSSRAHYNSKEQRFELSRQSRELPLDPENHCACQTSKLTNSSILKHSKSKVTKGGRIFCEIEKESLNQEAAKHSLNDDKANALLIADQEVTCKWNAPAISTMSSFHNSAAIAARSQLLAENMDSRGIFLSCFCEKCQFNLVAEMNQELSLPNHSKNTQGVDRVQEIHRTENIEMIEYPKTKRSQEDKNELKGKQKLLQRKKFYVLSVDDQSKILPEFVEIDSSHRKRATSLTVTRKPLNDMVDLGNLEELCLKHTFGSNRMHVDSMDHEGCNWNNENKVSMQRHIYVQAKDVLFPCSRRSSWPNLYFTKKSLPEMQLHITPFPLMDKHSIEDTSAIFALWYDHNNKHHKKEFFGFEAEVFPSGKQNTVAIEPYVNLQRKKRNIKRSKVLYARNKVAARPETSEYGKQSNLPQCRTSVRKNNESQRYRENFIDELAIRGDYPELYEEIDQDEQHGNAIFSIEKSHSAEVYGNNSHDMKERTITEIMRVGNKSLFQLENEDNEKSYKQIWIEKSEGEYQEKQTESCFCQICLNLNGCSRGLRTGAPDKNKDTFASCPNLLAQVHHSNQVEVERLDEDSLKTSRARERCMNSTVQKHSQCMQEAIRKANQQEIRVTMILAKKKRADYKAIQAMLSVLGLFMLSWLPLLIALLIKISEPEAPMAKANHSHFNKKYRTEYFMHISNICNMLNALLNPILYVTRTGGFKRTLHRMKSKCSCFKK